MGVSLLSYRPYMTGYLLITPIRQVLGWEVGVGVGLGHSLSAGVCVIFCVCRGGAWSCSWWSSMIGEGVSHWHGMAHTYLLVKPYRSLQTLFFYRSLTKKQKSWPNVPLFRFFGESSLRTYVFLDASWSCVCPAANCAKLAAGWVSAPWSALGSGEVVRAHSTHPAPRAE